MQMICFAKIYNVVIIAKKKRAHLNPATVCTEGCTVDHMLENSAL